MRTIALFHTASLTGTENSEFICTLAKMLSKTGNRVILICQEPEPDKFDFIQEAFRFKSEQQTLYKLFERPKDNTSPHQGECLYFRPDCGSTIPKFFNSEESSKFSKPIEELKELELDNYINRNIRALKKINTLISIDTILTLWCSPGGAIIKRCFGKSIPLNIIVKPPIDGAATIPTYTHEYKLGAEALRCAARIITHAYADLELIRLAYPNEATSLHIKIIPHCIDTKEFHPIIADETLPQETIEQISKSIHNISVGFSLTALKVLAETKTIPDIAKWENSTQRINHLNPDADIEKKLTTYLQGKPSTIFIIGDLENTTGIHDSIIALPLVIKKCPTLQVLIASHGNNRGLIEKMTNFLCEGKLGMVKECLSQLSPECIHTPGLQFINSLNENQQTLYTQNAMSLVGHIHFCGNLPEDLHTTIMQHSQIAEIPHLNKKAMPSELLKAMACGCIPIVSDEPEYTTIIPSANASGALILKTNKEKHITESASCILRALAYPTDETLQLADLAWKYINENHSWSAHAKDYL